MSEYHASVARWERNKRKGRKTSYMEDSNQSSSRIRKAFVDRYFGKLHQIMTIHFVVNVLTYFFNVIYCAYMIMITFTSIHNNLLLKSSYFYLFFCLASGQKSNNQLLAEMTHEKSSCVDKNKMVFNMYTLQVSYIINN